MLRNLAPSTPAAGIVCSDNCKCLDCKNYEGSEAREALISPQVRAWDTFDSITRKGTRGDGVCNCEIMLDVLRPPGGCAWHLTIAWHHLTKGPPVIGCVVATMLSLAG